VVSSDHGGRRQTQDGTDGPSSAKVSGCGRVVEKAHAGTRCDRADATKGQNGLRQARVSRGGVTVTRNRDHQLDGTEQGGNR